MKVQQSQHTTDDKNVVEILAALKEAVGGGSAALGSEDTYTSQAEENAKILRGLVAQLQKATPVGPGPQAKAKAAPAVFQEK